MRKGGERDRKRSGTLGVVKKERKREMGLAGDEELNGKSQPGAGLCLVSLSAPPNF